MFSFLLSPVSSVSPCKWRSIIKATVNLDLMSNLGECLYLSLQPNFFWAFLDSLPLFWRHLWCFSGKIGSTSIALCGFLSISLFNLITLSEIFLMAGKVGKSTLNSYPFFVYFYEKSPLSIMIKRTVYDCWFRGACCYFQDSVIWYVVKTFSLPCFL